VRVSVCPYCQCMHVVAGWLRGRQTVINTREVVRTVGTLVRGRWLCALTSAVCRRSPIRRRCGSGRERESGGWLGVASVREFAEARRRGDEAYTRATSDCLRCAPTRSLSLPGSSGNDRAVAESRSRWSEGLGHCQHGCGASQGLYVVQHRQQPRRTKREGSPRIHTRSQMHKGSRRVSTKTGRQTTGREGAVDRPIPSSMDVPWVEVELVGARAFLTTASLAPSCPSRRTAREIKWQTAAGCCCCWALLVRGSGLGRRRRRKPKSDSWCCSVAACAETDTQKRAGATGDHRRQCTDDVKPAARSACLTAAA
jgi:hypothetical protein